MRIGLIARVLFAGLSMFYLLTIWVDPPDPLRTTDSQSYWFTASSLVENGEFRERFDTGTTPSTWRPPLTALVLAAAIKTGLQPSSILTVYCLLVILSAYLLSRGTRYLGASDETAFVSACVLLLHPETFFSTRGLMSEALFLVLASSAVYFCLRGSHYCAGTGHRHAVGWFLFSGLLSGLALLTRSVMVAFLPGLILIIVTGVRRRSEKDQVFARRLLHLSIFALGVIFVVVPWQIRNQRVLHDFVFINTAASYNLFIGNVYDSSVLEDERARERIRMLRSKRSEAEVARILRNESLLFILRNPAESLSRFVRNSMGYWTEARSLYGSILQLILLGASVWVLRMRHPTVTIPLLIIPILLTMLHSLTFLDPRFFLPSLIPCSLLTAVLFDAKEKHRLTPAVKS